MKNLSLILCVSLLLFGCEKRDVLEDDLNFVKRSFLDTIFSSQVEEGPFHMHYMLKTVFFSKDLISLFGEVNVYDCLPHGWKHYEGKTYFKRKGKFQEVALGDLFTNSDQREFLRDYCEKAMKKDPLTYFAKENPFKTKLFFEDIRTFIIDDQFLTVIFQPYVAVSSADSPFTVKIPFDDLKGKSNHPLFLRLKEIILAKDFVCSFEEEEIKK